MAPFSNKLNAAGDFWTLKASDERSNDDVETFDGDVRIGDGENIEFEEGKKWKPRNIRHYRNMYKKNDTELEGIYFCYLIINLLGGSFSITKYDLDC